jgi:hypothetical protein
MTKAKTVRDCLAAIGSDFNFDGCESLAQGDVPRSPTMDGSHCK